MAKSDCHLLSSHNHSELGGPADIHSRVVKLHGFKFTVDKRYNIFDIVGTGAYGVVAAAVDKLTGKQVAIKKFEVAFKHHTLAKRTLRELKIMRLLQHDNILGIESIQLPMSYERLDDIYVVSELMETDLSSLIKSEQDLTDEHCSFFLYQILRGLKYMHSANVVHRDLKPRNILLNSDCDLKICDLGLARICTGMSKAVQMTDYVATRWYRSPELLLKLQNYHFAIDIWSVGCILGEMLLRKPLMPGSSSLDQIRLILKLVGKPSEDLVNKIPDAYCREMVRNRPEWPKIPIAVKFSQCNPVAVDLLKKMLSFDPDERITIEQALNHPYLSHFHLMEDEPMADLISPYDFSFEKRQLNMTIVKNLIYEEILLYHFHQSKAEYECDKSTFHKMSNSMFCE